jgi:sodium/potassium-transporting ATPase subunit alpha
MGKGAYSEVVRASIDLKSRASVEIMARSDPAIRASQQRMRDIATGAAAPGKTAPIPENASAVAEKREKERANINATVKAADVIVHTYSLEEMTNMLKTNLTRGLTAAEATAKLAKDGPNVLTPPPETPWYVKLAMQMVGGFQVMMIVGAILCFIVGPISHPIDYQTIYLGIVLVIVVVSTGFFAWWQERKSDSVMAGFKALTPARCNVVRDGQVIEIDAKELVQGDICMVNFGEKVLRAGPDVLSPASLTLCSGARRLPYSRSGQSQGRVAFFVSALPNILKFGPLVQVDNSSLTGEPEPLRRVPEMTDESPFETKNLAFYGTFFTEGSGKVVVYATGDRTFLGNIASSTLNTVKNQSTLNIEIHHFIKIMATIAISLGVVFFIVAITAVKYPILEVPPHSLSIVFVSLLMSS